MRYALAAAASACGRCSASRPARRSARSPRSCCRRRRGRARPHVLARPRRPARARRRRGCGAGGRARRAQFGEDVAVLAGDALLAEAFRLALAYDARGRARAGGRDARDDRRPVPRRDGLRRRPRGAPPAEDGPPLLGRGARARRAQVAGSEPQTLARVRAGARRALPARRRHPRRRRLRPRPRSEETRRRADEAAERALAALAELDVDTSVLRGLVEGLASRTA